MFETIAISWIYGDFFIFVKKMINKILLNIGTKRFCDDIRDMVGFTPGIYWRFCWKFAAPVFLMFIIVYGLIGYEPL